MPRRLVLMVIPALVAGMTLVVHPSALAQNVPTVDVTPVGTTSDDPNAGQWFFATLSPKQTTRMTARIANPATVDQSLRLYLADLVFTADGTPQVLDRSTDVGTWGAFDSPAITVPAARSVEVGFSVSAPEGAEPGDHVGVVVAETQPQGNGPIKIVKRTATRLYVTVPGDAVREFVIEKVTTQRDSAFFARNVTVTTVLRNTGRVRLQTKVHVNSSISKGPALLLSHSIEPFISVQNVPFWGGPQRYQIIADTKTNDGLPGPTHLVYASVFVIPWHLLVLLVVGALLTLAARRMIRRRGSKYTAIKSDLIRIERLLSNRSGGDAGVDASPSAPEPDADLAIQAAMKQARRVGDEATSKRLEDSLRDRTAVAPASPEDDPHASGLAAILTELATAPPRRSDRLVQAAQAFGRDALVAHVEEIEALPLDVRMKLFGKRQVSRRADWPVPASSRTRRDTSGRDATKERRAR